MSVHPFSFYAGKFKIRSLLCVGGCCAIQSASDVFISPSRTRIKAFPPRKCTTGGRPPRLVINVDGYIFLLTYFHIWVALSGDVYFYINL